MMQLFLLFLLLIMNDIIFLFLILAANVNKLFEFQTKNKKYFVKLLQWAKEDSNFSTARFQYDYLLKQGGFTDHCRYLPIIF